MSRSQRDRCRRWWPVHCKQKFQGSTLDSQKYWGVHMSLYWSAQIWYLIPSLTNQTTQYRWSYERVCFECPPLSRILPRKRFWPMNRPYWVLVILVSSSRHFPNFPSSDLLSCSQAWNCPNGAHIGDDTLHFCPLLHKIHNFYNLMFLLSNRSIY